MSVSFEVSSSTGPYAVTVAEGLFAEMAARLEHAHVIADAYFRDRVHGAREPIFIEATEAEKSFDRAPALIERMRAQGVSRKSQVVAIGGGVIQDISAFAASVYMRGVPWVYVPTTVLAMVDSCIGGKSSINVGAYKNLVGTFHPPEHIYIDPALAETLPRDQFASGLIEAAKICFCRGAESFARHLSYEPSTTMKTSALEQVIVNSLEAKRHFIEIDEFDKKERLLLNFGHTFGHAIEGASQYGIAHGIGVGLGILCSLEFQRQRAIDVDAVERVDALERHLRTMMQVVPDLQDELRKLKVAEVLERFASDKKHTQEHFALILISATGNVVLEKMERTPELTAKIRRGIEATISSVLTEGYTR